MERRREGKVLYHAIHDYTIITLAMLIGVVGWHLFLLPNHIPMGGITGVASIIYWGWNVAPQYSFFVINAILLIAALKVLGWRFCIKTIYGVVVFTLASAFIQKYAGNFNILADQKFMATMVGGVFMGTSVGLGLSAGGSTGGSDVIAAMIHKYRDISLGNVILFCDVAVITSSYLVLRDWEQVLYGYVLLFVLSFCVDHIVNSLRQSVQFFIVSKNYKEIGQAINEIAQRGCSTLDGNGCYSGQEIKVVFCIAKKSESSIIFDLIDEIDPDAFVAQSAVIGVYGQGFDRFKVKKRQSVKEQLEKMSLEEND
jgi:uncharacterized membrane-anchored protein YitT (DUF2179 family)